MVRYLVAAALALNCSFASAGSAHGTVIQYFSFEVSGAPPLWFIFISSSATNAASCAGTTASQNRWSIRADTPAGKAHMLAIVLAKVTGRPVTIIGKGGVYANPCEDWADTESIHMVITGE